MEALALGTSWKKVKTTFVSGSGGVHTYHTYPSTQEAEELFQKPKKKDYIYIIYYQFLHFYVIAANLLCLIYQLKLTISVYVWENIQKLARSSFSMENGEEHSVRVMLQVYKEIT